jgi:nifR3 family TIM-barrel protein
MALHLKDYINRPLTIGTKTISNRLALAPMTYLGHVAFRQMLMELGGCGLMFSEMCSAGRIPTENPRVSSYFRWRDEEVGHLSVQILGAEPARMAAAARRIENEGLFGVDINLGCAVKSVCRFEQGAGLLKEPAKAVVLVRRVREAVSCPVTVKFRTGWEDDPAIPVDLARRLEDAGADMLTFHPRVAPDRRNRPPRWEYIGMVKQAVSIPVLGNGDVFSADDCLKMMETTGCDGVALGRVAVARPWIFDQWSRGGDDYSAQTCRRAALRLLALTRTHFDGVRALRRYKRYAAYLSANFVFGNSLFNRLRNAPDLATIEDTLNQFLDKDPKPLQQPNLNLMR